MTWTLLGKDRLNRVHHLTLSVGGYGGAGGHGVGQGGLVPGGVGHGGLGVGGLGAGMKIPWKSRLKKNMYNCRICRQKNTILKWLSFLLYKCSGIVFKSYWNLDMVENKQMFFSYLHVYIFKTAEPHMYIHPIGQGGKPPKPGKLVHLSPCYWVM